MKWLKFGLNPLSFLAFLLLLFAMFYPWWSLSVSVMHQPTNIYPYLIDGPISEFVGYRRSPQMQILLDLLISCIVLFGVGSFIKGKVIAISTSVSAVMVALAIWRFLLRMAGVAKLYNVPIQGHGVGDYGGFAFVDVYTKIQPGIYLATLAVVVGIFAGIFHKKLTNKFSLHWKSAGLHPPADSSDKNNESNENGG